MRYEDLEDAAKPKCALYDMADEKYVRLRDLPQKIAVSTVLPKKLALVWAYYSEGEPCLAVYDGKNFTLAQMEDYQITTPTHWRYALR